MNECNFLHHYKWNGGNLYFQFNFLKSQNIYLNFNISQKYPSFLTYFWKVGLGLGCIWQQFCQSDPEYIRFACNAKFICSGTRSTQCYIPSSRPAGHQPARAKASWARQSSSYCCVTQETPLCYSHIQYGSDSCILSLYKKKKLKLKQTNRSSGPQGGLAWLDKFQNKIIQTFFVYYISAARHHAYLFVK